MSDRRPNEEISTQLLSGVAVDSDTIPVLTVTPFNIDTRKQIGGPGGEFIRCTGIQEDPWPAFTGCERGVSPEDGGSEPREWEAGTVVTEVPWSTVEIVRTIPTPTRAMSGRQFVYEDAQGNVYTFNVAVYQDGTPYIDWVNEPPPDPDAEVTVSFTQLVAIAAQPSVGGVAMDGSDNLAVASPLTGAGNSTLRRFSSVYAQQWSQAIGAARHVASDVTNIFVALLSGEVAKRVASSGAAGSPATFSSPDAYGVVMEPAGTHLWVVNKIKNRVTKHLQSNGDVVSYIQNDPLGWTHERNIESNVAPHNTSINATRQLAIGPNGSDIWRASAGNNSIKAFDQWGNDLPDIISGSVDNSSGIYRMPNGDFYVVFHPSGSMRIAKYNAAAAQQWSTGVGGTGSDVYSDGTYVFATKGGNEQILKRLATDGSAVGSPIGTQGTGDGQFAQNSPIGITGDGTHFYAVDTGNHRIQKFLISDNSFVSKWGTFGIGSGQFNTPTSIYYRDSKLWVLDSGNARVQVFDTDGNWLETIAVSNAIDSRGIVTDGDQLYVGDETGGVPTKYRKYIKARPASSAPGKFNNPTAAALSPDGLSLFVLDAGNGRVNEYLVSDHSHVATYTMGSGNSPGQISLAAEGLTIDNDGNIWIADTNNHRINVYDNTGLFLYKIGSFGSGAKHLNTPRQIAFNAARDVLHVADSGNHRIVSIRPTVLSPFEPVIAFPAAGQAVIYDGADWVNQDIPTKLFVPFIMAPNKNAPSSEVQWLNMPAAATELYGVATNRKLVDLTGVLFVRLSVEVTVVGFAGAYLQLYYATNLATPVWTAIPATAVVIDALGWQNSGWVAWPAGAATVVLLRIVGVGGNASLDPSFINIGAQFR